MAEPLDLARLVAAWGAAGLFAPGERVLVALSGGADSVALAALLGAAREHGLPLDLTLAHLDHGWRGPQEAALDRALVGALAARLRLPLVTAGPPRPPASGEEAARRWRYATLAALARESGCTAVAVGHHLRDQAETVLARLLRGSGPHGLTGMRPTRTLDGGRLRVVRPLLGVHPERLRAWSRSVGLAWREDPTNRLPGERNDLRRRLEALEARSVDATATLAALARRLEARLERRHGALRIAVAAATHLHAPGAATRLPRALLEGRSTADLAEALRAFGACLGADASGPWFTRRHVERIRGLLVAGGALDLPRGLALRVTPRWVWLLRRAPPPLERWHLDLRLVPRASFDLDLFVREAVPFAAALDAQRLGPAPRLRRLEPGDRFVPFGRGARGAVEVEQWLARHGVPRLARRATLVVEGASGIAWVLGARLDATHALTPATIEVAALRLSEG